MASSRKTGRPKKSAVLKKGSPISFRPTAQQRAALETRAKTYGLAVSEYALLNALREPVRVETVARRDPGLVQQLKLIGSNLNQLTRKFNTTGEAPPPELRVLLNEIRALIWQELQTLRTTEAA